MSEFPSIDSLLTEAGLRDKAEPHGEGLFRMQWGSAIVMVGASGSAVVAIAPLFKAPPVERKEAFFQKLLEHNAFMGGMAAFAVQDDGWVVLHAGRPLKGLDGDEFATLVSSVGRFADQFDDQLAAGFFAKAGAAAGAASDATAPAE